MACAESGGVLKDAIFDDVLALKQPTAMWPRPVAVGAPNARGNVLRQQRLRSVLCQASQFHLLCIAPSIRKDPMTACWLNICCSNLLGLAQVLAYLHAVDRCVPEPCAGKDC